ncbi:putative DNA binding protein [Rhizophagus irregularis]|uniref:Putative DNA binding protein n=1 Tax=Rhizophagus irregularis TaxID=588596 RepID=A0A2N0QNM9_9GLOM|nr:putative DNA binding protein [Rhizophagus irregularis]
MEVTIGQFAKLVGSTVRTLRYYDKIGLLTPKNLNQNGRKVYTRLDWEIFQKIVISKNLGLSLSEIKEQLTNEKLSNRELLLVQKQLITRKQEELNDILEVITRMDRLYNLEADKQLMKEIKLLHDPEYKMKMDRETWHLIQAIKNAIQYNDSTSRKKRVETF